MLKYVGLSQILALHLKDFALQVAVFSPFPRVHYLNITLNNVVKVYILHKFIYDLDMKYVDM